MKCSHLLYQSQCELSVDLTRPNFLYQTEARRRAGQNQSLIDGPEFLFDDFLYLSNRHVCQCELDALTFAAACEIGIPNTQPPELTFLERLRTLKTPPRHRVESFRWLAGVCLGRNDTTACRIVALLRTMAMLLSTRSRRRRHRRVARVPKLLMPLPHKDGS